MVCAKFAHTTQHGAIEGKIQTSIVQLYNLDVIISVGYRVKSQRGTQFRIWANSCRPYADDCRKPYRRKGCNRKSRSKPDKQKQLKMFQYEYGYV